MKRKKLSDDQRRANQLESYRRYNSSHKGRARYARYESKHPERVKNRWEPARNRLHHERES